MIEKISEYGYLNSLDEATVHKIEGKKVEDFPAKFIPDKLKEFLKSFKPVNGNVYVLNSALGSGHIYGPNSRGDVFPEEGLSHKGIDYGHLTYEYYGGLYKHHINKEPIDSSSCFGEVILSDWDPIMHRVLLVIRVPIKGNDDIIARINNNEGIHTSMASKQPYDICVSPFTRIDCKYRKKYITDIIIGDEVLTHNGEYKKVTKVFVRNPVGKLLSIQNSWTYSPLNITNNHPIYCIKRNQIRWNGINGQHLKDNPDFTPNFIEAGSLEKGDYLLYPINDEERDCEVNNKYLAKLIGYYLAGGSISTGYSNHNENAIKLDQCINLCFNILEKYLIEDVIECCKYCNFKYSVFDDENKNSSTINIYSKWLCAFMREYCGIYSHFKFLHKDLLFMNKEYQKYLLGAYIEGDGSQDKEKESLRTCSVSYNLIGGISRLLLRSRIKHSIGLLKIKSGFSNKNTVKNAYQIFIPASQTKLISDYAVSIVPSEKNESSQMIFHNGYYLSPITHIRSAYVPEKVYNLEVEENQSYVADNIIVHNCSICGNISKRISNHCDHVNNHLLEIYPDGRQSFMINPYPKFFDISLVTRGAARESKMMGELSKIILNAKDILQPPEIGIEKTVTETPSVVKEEIVETKPVETLGETPNPELSPIKDLVAKLNVESDKTIDKSILDNLGKFNIEEILSTMLGMGIMPQKKEFQYLMLSRVDKNLADKNYETNLMGEKSAEVKEYKFNNYKYNEKIAEILSPYLKERTWLGEFVSNRNFSKSNDTEKQSSEVLTDLTDMYYQIKEAARSESILEQILHMPPSVLTLFLALMGGVYGSAPYLMTREYNKPTEKQALGTMGKALLVPPLGMAYGLYQRNRMERGVPISKANQLAAAHPVATGLAAGAASLYAPSLKKKLSLRKIKEKFTKMEVKVPEVSKFKKFINTKIGK